MSISVLARTLNVLWRDMLYATGTYVGSFVIIGLLPPLPTALTPAIALLGEYGSCIAISDFSADVGTFASLGDMLAPNVERLSQNRGTN